MLEMGGRVPPPQAVVVGAERGLVLVGSVCVAEAVGRRGLGGGEGLLRKELLTRRLMADASSVNSSG